MRVNVNFLPHTTSMAFQFFFYSEYIRHIVLILIFKKNRKILKICICWDCGIGDFSHRSYKLVTYMSEKAHEEAEGQDWDLDSLSFSSCPTNWGFFVSS